MAESSISRNVFLYNFVPGPHGTVAPTEGRGLQRDIDLRRATMCIIAGISSAPFVRPYSSQSRLFHDVLIAPVLFQRIPRRCHTLRTPDKLPNTTTSSFSNSNPM
jgi:hypothetical protein